MASEDKKISRFNVIRLSIIAVIFIGFLGFPLFKLLPKSYEYLVVFYVAVFVILLLLIIGCLYRCPFCNSLPRGYPIPYIDLAPSRCRVCGHSLRDSVDGNASENP